MTSIELTATLSSNVEDALKIIRAHKVNHANIEEIKKALNPNQHDVTDTGKRPDRMVTIDTDRVDQDGNPIRETHLETVNRIPVGLQKQIVKKMASFLFGNPVVITSMSSDKNEQEALKGLLRVLKDNKMDARNKQTARLVGSCKEAAEIWYAIETNEEHENYGFKTKAKLRSTTFSPLDGSTFYPVFDDYGDMIAFGREYLILVGDKQVNALDVYTDQALFMYRQNQEHQWALADTKENKLGKIPVAYVSQDETEFEDVQLLIDRLENLLSNHADTNDYNGSPTVVAEGDVLSLGKKGEQGKLLEIEKGGKVEYLSWDHAPESIKMEIENLLYFIRTLTQTPDFSFEVVKDINQISGTAIKLLFMDAHLKAQDKFEIFEPFLARRHNIIKAFFSILNPSQKAVYKKLDIVTELRPYMIEDEKDRVEILLALAGNKPAMSQKKLIEEVGYTSDVEAEYAQIQEEQQRENSFTTI